MAGPLLAPLLWLGGGATVAAAAWGFASAARETGDALEDAGNAAQKSTDFMDRVIVLSVIAVTAYFGAKAAK